MKNIKKIKLSEELREVFKYTWEDVTYNYGKVILVDNIIYSLVELYICKPEEKRGKSKNFSNFLDKIIKEHDIDVDSLIDVFSVLHKKIIFTNETELPKSMYKKDSVMLSTELTTILSRLNNKVNNDISILDFLEEAFNFNLDNSRSINSLNILEGYYIVGETLTNYNKKLQKSNEDEFIDFMNSEPFEKSIDYEFSPENSIEKDNEDSDEDDREFEMAGESRNNQDEDYTNSKTPFLDKYTTDFTEQAKCGKFDPVIGRDKEISQIIEILGCRKKKNCILTGLPGIGKTSIVQEISRRIVSNEVPRELLGKKIKSLDLTALVSGAIYRGQAEERAMGVCKEASEDPNIILYIDEIHNIIGNGSNSGTGGTDEIMKPYLSNNDGITVIGSTTDEEYRKFIEKNGAFKRRFQEVSVSEPDIEETIDILKKLTSKYEEFHKVKYTEEVIRACVEWSNQYINDRFFPDKAIDLMDISGSLTKFERIIDTSAIENLEKSIDSIIKEKTDLIKEGDFEESKKKWDLELRLKDELSLEKEKYNDNLNDSNNWPEVTVDKVANIVSKLSRVPVDKIRQTSLGKLKSMREVMEKTVIGQDEVIKEITMSLNRQFMGIKDPEKPASFLMVGPTGTGKTYCAKKIAEQIFGGDKSLIRIDCSEYIEKYSVSKLLGSTAGYIGYEDEPVLLKVKRKPFSVVLFDEIEKMSEEIINTVFLPILDEGYVSLANGTKVSFRNSIIIMTSNIGVKELEKKTNLGFTKLSEEENDEKDKDIIMKAIKKKFKPEVINRFGKIIFFKTLGDEELMKIFDLELEKLKDRLSNRGMYVKVTEEMKKFIVSKCDKIYGARDLQRGIVKYIEDAICEKMISMENPDNCGNFVKIDIVNNNPVVSFSSSFDVKIENKKIEPIMIN